MGGRRATRVSVPGTIARCWGGKPQVPTQRGISVVLGSNNSSLEVNIFERVLD